jgi:hypothetical protein
MPARGKHGKPRTGFPPFPPSLEIPHKRRDSHIPTASTTTYICQPRPDGLAENRQPRGWAKLNCRSGPKSVAKRTIDASGVKRLMPQTLEFKGSGKDLTASQVSRQGTLIPLKVVVDETGTKMTVMRELDFEGGEHIRWHLELKDGHLTGAILCVHDAPKKWEVDWSGPLDFTRVHE